MHNHNHESSFPSMIQDSMNITFDNDVLRDIVRKKMGGRLDFQGVSIVWVYFLCIFKHLCIYSF